MFVHIRRTPWTLLVLVGLAIALVGCGSFGDLPVPDVPDVPDDGGPPKRDDGDMPREPEEPRVGDGPMASFKGRVVFADTDLALRATVIFGEKEIDTPDGTFDVDIPHGKNTYSLKTRLGDSGGNVNHDGSSDRSILAFPAFEGWSPSYFNMLLTARKENSTVRWVEGAFIPVWIESSEQNGLVNPGAPDIAWDAFVEWQDIVGDAFTFQRVNSRTEAADDGIIVEFRPQAEIAAQFGDQAPDAIGMCTFFYLDGEITQGEIWIAYNEQDSPALHRHEIGHCIGLNHSSDRGDVMYGSMDNSEKPISEMERHITQLLYSIAPGTEGFSHPLALRQAPFDDGIYVELPDGTVQRTIPTYAKPSL